MVKILASFLLVAIEALFCLSWRLQGINPVLLKDRTAVASILELFTCHTIIYVDTTVCDLSILN